MTRYCSLFNLWLRKRDGSVPDDWDDDETFLYDDVQRYESSFLISKWEGEIMDWDEMFGSLCPFLFRVQSGCTQCYRWTVKHEDCWGDNNNEGSRYYCVLSEARFPFFVIPKKWRMEWDEEGGDPRLRWDEFRRSEERTWMLVRRSNLWVSRWNESHDSRHEERIQDEELHLLPACASQLLFLLWGEIDTWIGIIQTWGSLFVTSVSNAGRVVERKTEGGKSCSPSSQTLLMKVSFLLKWIDSNMRL